MILVGSTYICIYSHTCVYIHNDNKEEKVMNLGRTENTERVGVGKRRNRNDADVKYVKYEFLKIYKYI